MVTGISLGLDSSEDECVAVRRWSAGQKFLESDDEAAEDSNVNVEVCKLIDSDDEPDTEAPGDNCESNCRVLMEETILDDVSVCNKKKKKKKWNILHDSDCSSDEETPSTYLSLTKGEVEVEHGFQSQLSLLKNNDLYDAEGSEDEVATKHNVGHSPETDFSVLKKSDLYDAEGCEDEVVPKHSTKHKVTSFSERKSKSKAVQQIHSETQRFVRESRLSLPYHKPRQRSLAEFLQRHHASVPSVPSLKMSTDDLGELWKELAQREKDAEHFYKSDSDDSCDHDAVEDRGVHGTVDVTSQITAGVGSSDTAPSIAVVPSIPFVCQSDASAANSGGASAAGVSASNRDVTSSVSASKLGVTSSVSASNHDVTSSVSASNHGVTSSISAGSHNVTSSVSGSNHDVTSSVSSSGADILTECIQETGVGIAMTSLGIIQETGSNQEATEGNQKSGTFVTGAKGVAGTQVVTSKHEATECSQEIDAVVSVAKNVPSRWAAYGDHDIMSVQSLVPEDSCDFQLHYSESQSVDAGASEVVTCSAVNGDRNSAIDICLEVANTEDFALHYTETQHFEHLSPDGEELQKQEKTACQENLVVPSRGSQGVNDSAEEVLQGPVQRSLPSQADIATLKPRLSAAPNGLVELDGEEMGSAGVRKLMQRFMKHSAVKQPQEKQTIEVGVVSAEKGVDGIEEVHKDTVKVTLGAEESNHDPAMAKPGAQLQRLKEELQQQIALRRSEEWSRRVQEQRLDNEEEDQLSECGGLEDELEGETTDAETESEEEEDIVLVEKKRVKSAFLDDEAEVSDDGEESDGEDDEVDDIPRGDSEATSMTAKSTFEEDEADVSDDGEGSGGEDDEVDDMPHGESHTAGMTVKSSFEDDEADIPAEHNDESKMSPASEQAIPDNSTVQETDETMASTQQLSADLEVAPIASSWKEKLERAKTLDLFASQEDGGGDSDLEMIPPYQPPGAVRKLVTPTVDRRKHILDFISPISNLTSLRDSPSTQSQCLSPLTGQMYSGAPVGVPKKLFTELGPSSLQDNMDELLGLCSGQFTGNLACLVDPMLETSHTGFEAELLGLCSGKFVSQPENLHSLEHDEGQSQPENPSRHKLVLCSTDDEEEVVVQTRTHKKHKKLDFSDDELDLENDASDELPDIREAKFVDYDSEENEVMGPSEPRDLAVSDFFEDEAELSESDWDSADEDEQGLDTLEFEEGDAEKLDQRKMKEQLDRIYMRHQLDKDRREVRMLQEILLEDGELHSEGGGRERKFRWKNINNADDSELPHQDSDSEGVDEVENEDEVMWRRMRHEREMFLQQQKVDDALGDQSDSQLLKLGWAALKRTNSEDSTKQLSSTRRTTLNPVMSPDPKCPFNLVARRGSFLARGQSALARIAELTRDSASGPVVGPKNSRNFVFATLSPEKVVDCSIETASVQMKKRKQDVVVTPPIVKRLRVSDKHSRGRRLLDLLN